MDSTQRLADQSEEAIYRKVTWRLSVLLFLGYMLNYLDRTNIGFAQLQMKGDVGISDAAYGFGAGLFFVSYVLFAIPSNIVLNKIGARRTICVSLCGWGLISSATMFIHTRNEFYTARCLLGAVEAGFYPGALFYFTQWYPSHRRAKIVGIFTSAAVVAGVVSGVLSGTLMTYLNGYEALRGWQWMFFLEGLPSIALGIVVYFFLDDKPAYAKWLSGDERKTIIEILRRDPAVNASQRAAGQAFGNWRVYLLGLIYFVIMFQTYALAFWQPTMIREFGVSSVVIVGLYSTVPPLVAIVAKVWIGYHSDRQRELRWHFAISAFIGVVGLFLTPYFSHSPILGIACLALATAGAHGCIPVFWSVPGLFLSGTAAAVGIALINAIGNTAGFIGPSLLGAIKTETGGFTLSLYIMASLLACGAVMMLALVPKQQQVASQAPGLHGEAELVDQAMPK